MEQREEEAQGEGSQGERRAVLGPALARLAPPHPRRPLLGGPELLRPRGRRLEGPRGVDREERREGALRPRAAARSPSSSPRTSTSARGRRLGRKVARAGRDAVAGGGPLEGPHPRAVPQPDRVGRRGLRLRGGRTPLVRQARLGPVGHRGRRPRRHDPEPPPAQPAGERRAPRAGHAPGAVAHGPGRLPRPRRGRPRRRAAARDGGRGRGAGRRPRRGTAAGGEPLPADGLRRRRPPPPRTPSPPRPETPPPA